MRKIGTSPDSCEQIIYTHIPAVHTSKTPKKLKYKRHFMRFINPLFLTNSLLRRILFFRFLPLGWLAGVKVLSMDANRCTVQLQTAWRNRNPFGSMYFGSLQLGAEVSMGFPVLAMINECPKNVSVLILQSRSAFHKRGKGKVNFVCDNLQKFRESLENQEVLSAGGTVELYSKAYNKDGTLVSETWITWGIRERKS
jgi:hypothetical protein